MVIVSSLYLCPATLCAPTEDCIYIVIDVDVAAFFMSAATVVHIIMQNEILLDNFSEYVCII